VTSNICNARKRTVLGTYICDLAPGHKAAHEDIWQHHSWPEPKPFWTRKKIINVGCLVAAYAIAEIAYRFGGAR
jgi:hypothetical protein